MPKRGAKCKIGYFRAFNYILKVLYTGMQWQELPIREEKKGKAEIHYTGIYKLYARWSSDGSLEKVFSASVKLLAKKKKLDVNWLQVSWDRLNYWTKRLHAVQYQ